MENIISRPNATMSMKNLILYVWFVFSIVGPFNLILAHKIFGAGADDYVSSMTNW